MTEDSPEITTGTVSQELVDKPKHPGGRPTIYTQELLERAQYYLENFEEYQDVIPQIAGLAIVLEVSRETIYDWSAQESKKQFSDIVTQIMAKQEKTLFNGGLDGTFNSSITKLALTKHGYHDKQEVDQTTKMVVSIGDKDAGVL